MSSPSPGDTVRLEMTKWGDTPHWRMDAVYLGRDEAGDWLGFPKGTFMSRPGMDFTTTNDQVGLVPAAGTAVGQAWLATFHGPGGNVWTYVDMTTVPKWSGRTLHAVDLDLDVIEALDRTVYVDDQDEFDRHRVELDYPREIVDLAMSTRDLVRTALTARMPPFDGSAAGWLAVLGETTWTPPGGWQRSTRCWRCWNSPSPTPELVETTARGVRDEDYLVRYKSANTLLHWAGRHQAIDEDDELFGLLGDDGGPEGWAEVAQRLAAAVER